MSYGYFGSTESTDCELSLTTDHLGYLPGTALIEDGTYDTCRYLGVNDMYNVCVTVCKYVYIYIFT